MSEIKTYSNDLSFPIGPYQAPTHITPEIRQQWMESIGQLPAKLRALVLPLTDAQLDTPYRPGGWTVRQVIHHVPDSHLHSYVRFKWTLTEQQPMIKAYDEKGWAALKDSSSAPIDISLDFLAVIHQRWLLALEHLEESDWKKSFIHPESGDSVVLDWNLGNYAWHGEHHYAHIHHLCQRMGW